MKQRQSNFELLRIVAIFIIIAVHVVESMIYIAFPEKMTWKYCAAVFSVSRSAVPVFVMLTGYFMYNSQKKVMPRIKRLALPYLFYVGLFTLYLLIFMPEGKNVLDIIGHQIVAVGSTRSEYFLGHMWYLYILVAVIIIAPYINILIDRLDRKMHFRLLLILSVLFFGIPTLNALLDINLIYEYSSDELRQLLFVFITYYFIGAYFSKYDVTVKKRKSVSLFIGATIMVFAFFIYLERLSSRRRDAPGAYRLEGRNPAIYHEIKRRQRLYDAVHELQLGIHPFIFMRADSVL